MASLPGAGAGAGRSVRRRRMPVQVKPLAGRMRTVKGCPAGAW